MKRSSGSQYERKALAILGFPMTFRGRAIGPGNGLDEDSYFIQDAVLRVTPGPPKLAAARQRYCQNAYFGESDIVPLHESSAVDAHPGNSTPAKLLTEVHTPIPHAAHPAPLGPITEQIRACAGMGR